MNMTNEIYYISANDKLILQLEQLSIIDDYVLKPYTRELDLQTVHNLLFIEPYKIEKDYLEIHNLWLKYLKRKNKFNIKVLVAGFQNINQPNYINLLFLKNKISSKMTNLKSIDLNEKLDARHESIEQKLLPFFKGHTHVSLTDRIIYFQMYMSNIHDIVNGLKKNQDYNYVKNYLFESTRIEWEKFIKRWKDYSHYFYHCPFVEETKEIKQCINDINNYLSTEKHTASLFKETNCFESSMKISDLLDQIKSYLYEKETNLVQT